MSSWQKETPWMLAGGLNASNVADAINISDALAVDVSSGSKKSPELKAPRPFIAVSKHDRLKHIDTYLELVIMNDQTAMNSYRNQPDEEGRFGIHGGRFVAETLMPLILNVEKAWIRLADRSGLHR